MCHLLFEDLTPLQFQPSEVFFGKNVTLTCGPPPSTLGFSSNTKAEWRLNGTLIQEDELHRFSTRNGAALLTISKFFVTDNGKKITTFTQVKQLLWSLLNNLAGVERFIQVQLCTTAEAAVQHSTITWLHNTLVAINTPSHIFRFLFFFF